MSRGSRGCRPRSATGGGFPGSPDRPRRPSGLLGLGEGGAVGGPEFGEVPRQLSLEAAIELFKKSDSPEDFEKRLNSENNDVNNLDLNEDGEIDYIRVVDNSAGDVHALVLQVAVSEKESQDVAVIEIEKQGVIPISFGFFAPKRIQF